MDVIMYLVKPLAKPIGNYSLANSIEIQWTISSLSLSLFLSLSNLYLRKKSKPKLSVDLQVFPRVIPTAMNGFEQDTI